MATFRGDRAGNRSFLGGLKGQDRWAFGFGTLELDPALLDASIGGVLLRNC